MLGENSNIEQEYLIRNNIYTGKKELSHGKLYSKFQS